ncbi:hypothetical protein ACW9KT_19825 [Hymenobacter sp. HD11105]
MAAAEAQPSQELMGSGGVELGLAHQLGHAVHAVDGGHAKPDPAPEASPDRDALQPATARGQPPYESAQHDQDRQHQQ